MPLFVANPDRPADKYPGYWRVKQFRRWLRNAASRLLARRPAAPLAGVPALDAVQIRRVIVCRRNTRMGNMLFLTPLLRALHTALPRAEIDLLIGSVDYSPLFERQAGVRRVWVMPEKGVFWPLHMLRLLFRLRRQKYDLSVEPTLNSFSNRLSARLCGARRSLGFQASNQWLQLTHPVMPDPAVRHEALMSLQLVSAAMPYAPPQPQRLQLELSTQERAAGASALASLLANHPGHGPIVGFFTEATGAKRLPRTWWLEWMTAMRQSGQILRLLQILPPEDASPLDPALPTLCETNLRRLAASLAALDLFVSCDTGPMHLASAAGTPTLGLFHASKSYRYRPLGARSLALDIDASAPRETAQAVLRQLKNRPAGSPEPALAVAAQA